MFNCTKNQKKTGILKQKTTEYKNAKHNNKQTKNYRKQKTREEYNTRISPVFFRCINDSCYYVCILSKIENSLHNAEKEK